MTRALRIKIIIVLVVLLGSLYFLYPTFRLVTMGREERTALEIDDPEEIDKLMGKAIKLGLDLSGGMHLVLEVDDSQLKDDEKRDVLDRALQIIRNRVDQFGVSEPTIQKEGAKRILVQLPGLQDAERAKRLIGQTAMLQWHLVRQQEEVVGILNKLDRVLKRAHGDSLIEITPSVADTAVGFVPEVPVAEETVDVLEETIPAAEETIPPAEETPPVPTPFDSSMVPESLLMQQTPDVPIDIPLQTMNKDKPFTSLLMSFYRDWLIVHEDNIPRVRRMLADPEVIEAIPEDSEFMWFDDWTPLPEGGRGKFLFLIAKDVTVSGANLVNAVPEADPQAPNRLLVRFRFNRKGAREFSRFTGENVGRFTAIVLDGRIRSFPVIRSKIPDGSGVIEGDFPDTEARDLAITLRAGALPAPMLIREERTVGPSLGADSIRMGIRAALFGLIIVIIFMIIYYQLSGGIASIALIFNLVILFGLLAYLGAALTLPGIAGIILTIGMAIDANVLIFERIREELRKAKTIRSAIDAGYDRAFTTILDANLTTLITAVVLWQFGTGPIKGFATTLSIGIIASMFTALVFSRVIFDLWTRSGRVKKLHI
ncbi:MAG: protein translocase subunit SecD [bacterium]|nr:MAG: protein translocase subunit SecD [bacterium]